MERLNCDIVFADQHIEAIMAGTKTHTIRLGWRDYKPGPTTLGAPSSGWYMNANITSVLYTRAGNVDVARYGYLGMDDFIECMRMYYPTFNLKSEVTIITFETT